MEILRLFDRLFLYRFTLRNGAAMSVVESAKSAIESSDSEALVEILEN
jgi:hypothetical protein